MTSRKGAEIIVDYLVREGVPYVFGMCGHGDIGLLDALYDRQKEITTISVHHESVAGFMADAYFRVRHEPVATFTSCGPGSANLPVALGSALMDSSAFLAITGNVATSQFNRGPFQETGRHYQADFPAVVRPYVKRSFQATRPEQLPLMLRQAFATMTQGRPGPAHLDVPLDVLVERTEAEAPDPALWRHGFSATVAAGEHDVTATLDMLLAAARPVIVAGHGVELADGSGRLVEFAAELGIPVAHSPLGKGVLDARAPLSLGSTGRNGTYQANRATRSADVILALGTRFDDRSTSSWLPGYTYSIPPTRLIHVDIDPAEIGRNYPPALGVIADAGVFLAQLLREVRRRRAHGAGERLTPGVPSRALWRADIAGWARQWEEHIAPHRVSDAEPVRPERLLAELRRVLPERGILVSDVGVHHNWIVQEWPAYAPRTLVQSWGFASMGFGVGGAMGAKLAAPDQPVVAVVGDGGFLLMPSAVATGVEYSIPVVWVVWNNQGFVSIRDQQQAYFGTDRTLATSFLSMATGDPYTPDYAAMARSMGADGVLVQRPGDLAGQLEAAVASGRPTVVDVRVDPDAKTPAAATWDLPPLPHPAPTFAWPDEPPGGTGPVRQPHTTAPVPAAPGGADPAWDQPWDVVVVGGGNAALVSALTAAGLGAQVLLVERAPAVFRGGNSRHTRNIRCAHEAADGYVTGPYPQAELRRDLDGVGTGPSNKALADLTIAESESVPRWMTGHGARWQPALRGTLGLARTNRFFLGGGKALLNSYYRTAARAGVTIRYETSVRALEWDGGTCTAVVASTRAGERRVAAKAVICASGGFEANIAWLSRYWGDAARNYHIRGPRYNDGTVLDLLLRAGRGAGRGGTGLPRGGGGRPEPQVRRRHRDPAGQHPVRHRGQRLRPALL